jgi:hypothetical protein
MLIQKLTKLKFLFILLLITLSNSQILPVPQQITQLINGVVTELNLTEKLALNNCIEEIKSISVNINQIPTDIQNENYISAITKTSELFADIVKVITKCPEMKTQIQNKINFFNIAYHNPGKFLHDGLSSNISFSGMKNLYYLLDELEEKDLTNAGITLGKVLENFSNFKLNSVNTFLSFLSEPIKKPVIEDSSCMEILEDMKNYLDIMVNNIFKDLELVKNAFNDFMRKLKEIPEVCKP